MVDKLDKEIKQYINIWPEIRDGGIKQVLPVLDKEGYLKALTKEIKDSYSNKAKDALKSQLSTFHKVANLTHYLRDILNVTENSLFSLRGLKDVLK